jgi:uncharacterized integral membrane protein
VGRSQPFPVTMSFKAVLKSIAFLILLFVVLYVGMYNTGRISFAFPLATPKPVDAPAALIFFVMFAIGVLAGTLLHGSAGGKKGGSKDK